MIRNLVEMVFWSATIAVTVGLYMNAVTNAEIETVASQDVAIQLVQSE
ncbi:MAG: hypothetical protein IZT60_06595 [Gammaproteobacteria bacterium]|nr:hypothetical protein [Gammaproteobacteria bacterium]